MGIQRLKKRLSTFGEEVVLGSGVTKVVIDGPALVYHVYHCLLAWRNLNCNPLDAQPSNEDVSIGFMRFLLELRHQGVEVDRIYFDGALPVTKRSTRLARMERYRQKLQVFCFLHKNGCKAPKDGGNRIVITPAKCFDASRPIPDKFRPVPDNPFMIPTVIEDLKELYTWSLVAKYASMCGVDESRGRLPWADKTQVVPGEADAYLAKRARETGATILTGDSDLFVYDLGPEGSLIFFDSLETRDWTTHFIMRGRGNAEIRAVCYRPANIARRWGIESIPRFAYEMNRDPQAGFNEHQRRSRDAQSGVKEASEYRNFLEQYGDVPTIKQEEVDETNSCSLNYDLLDPRVSELVLQFKRQGFSEPNESPHMYLTMLVEHHDRKCAWSEGSEIRRLAYSLLNLSLSDTMRQATVMEHARRGERIAADECQMMTLEEAVRSIKDLLQRLRVLRKEFKGIYCATQDLDYWRLFALYELCGSAQESQKPMPKREHVSQFLEFGYIENKLSWDDIHLYAQMQSILYSLRILKQLLGVALRSLATGIKEPAAELAAFLKILTPMRHLVTSRQEINRESNERIICDMLDCMYYLLKRSVPRGDETDDISCDENHRGVCAPRPGSDALMEEPLSDREEDPRLPRITSEGSTAGGTDEDLPLPEASNKRKRGSTLGESEKENPRQKNNIFEALAL